MLLWLFSIQGFDYSRKKKALAKESAVELGFFLFCFFLMMCVQQNETRDWEEPGNMESVFFFLTLLTIFDVFILIKLLEIEPQQE